MRSSAPRVSLPSFGAMVSMPSATVQRVLDASGAVAAPPVQSLAVEEQHPSGAFLGVGQLVRRSADGRAGRCRGCRDDREPEPFEELLADRAPLPSAFSTDRARSSSTTAHRYEADLVERREHALEIDLASSELDELR